MKRSVLLAFGLSACATTQAQTPPTVPTTLTSRVEERALPVDPGEEALPQGIPVAEWVEPQEAGACFDQRGTVQPGVGLPCPARAGILVSEGRAARDGLYRVRYRELRTHYQGDRQVWMVQRELYETRLRLADQRIREMQPTWWQQNGAYVALGVGLVAGLGVSIVTVSALRVVVGP